MLWIIKRKGFDIHLIVCLCVVVAFCVLCTSIHTHVLNYLQSTVRYLQNCVPKPHILTYKGLHSTVVQQCLIIMFSMYALLRIHLIMNITLVFVDGGTFFQKRIPVGSPGTVSCKIF